MARHAARLSARWFSPRRLLLVGALAEGWSRTCAEGLRNCTVERCDNAKNLCGDFTESCVVVANILAGPSIWVKVDFSFSSDKWFRRKELAAFSQEACEKDDHWMKIEYEGEWHEHGPSTTTLGFNIVRVDMKSTWITLMKDKVCIEQQIMSRKKQCLSTYSAMQDLCPCNGWDWSSTDGPLTRNIGMFCSPREQCPVLHNVLVQSTHYLSYNATPMTACLSRASTSEERGWTRPEDDRCFKKSGPEDCIVGSLRAVGAAAPSASPSLLALLAAAVAALAACSLPPAAAAAGVE